MHRRTYRWLAISIHAAGHRCAQTPSGGYLARHLAVLGAETQCSQRDVFSQNRVRWRWFWSIFSCFQIFKVKINFFVLLKPRKTYTACLYKLERLVDAHIRCTDTQFYVKTPIWVISPWVRSTWKANKHYSLVPMSGCCRCIRHQKRCVETLSAFC